MIQYRYASWSIDYYKKVIDGCLDAVGAPRDLVQFVVGYGEAGSALVSSGVDKVSLGLEELGSYRGGYYSILVASYVMWSGALDGSGVLLSHSVMPLASHMTNILISTLKHIFMLMQIIFVGSPEVGAIVARTASANLTPVVLELGGKDPFVVCDDVDVDSIVQTACRGVWQNMGQNCAGPERFFVYEKVSLSLSHSLSLRVLFLCTNEFLFHVEWCIRQL